jgi:2-oxoglutarate ferredoxin oxidoreductase subunit alpha
MEYTIRIGGEAGQGLQVIGGVLAKYFAGSGFEVFTNQDYMSRIRGGHNYYQIRVSEQPVASPRNRVDILLALNQETIDIHRRGLNKEGVILYDAATCDKEFQGDEFLDIPLARIIEEMEVASIMENAVAVGAVIGLLGLELESLDDIFGKVIHKKGNEVITTNLAAARKGFDFVNEKYAGRKTYHLAKPDNKKRMLINGNQAIGLGALAGGCKFYSAYPMTPSTGIMVFLAANAEKHKIIVEQAEDEIAAINMALGASFAGVRAMTGTSGGGFALMTEGLSLAGMTEIPLVIAEVQRPGPATGFPTRTEQGDLFFVIHGGHGEFPRVVFTPGSPEQAFYLTNKAFHLAEKYQIPVFIQSDQYLADSEWTFSGFDTERLRYKDFRLRGKDLEQITAYKRYAFTDDGVSPLAVPGQSKHLVVVDSDEHDEEGHIVEDAPTRISMIEKRLYKKMPLIQKEISPPTYHGDPKAEVVLIGYGSTYGVMKEAWRNVSDKYSVGMLHFTEICPFPLTDTFDYVSILKLATHTLCLENNATGQFARLLRMEVGYSCTDNILKYDGRPFELGYLIGEINAILG